MFLSIVVVAVVVCLFVCVFVFCFCFVLSVCAQVTLRPCDKTMSNLTHTKKMLKNVRKLFASVPESITREFREGSVGR